MWSMFCDLLEPGCALLSPFELNIHKALAVNEVSVCLDVEITLRALNFWRKKPLVDFTFLAFRIDKQHGRGENIQ